MNPFSTIPRFSCPYDVVLLLCSTTAVSLLLLLPLLLLLLLIFIAHLLLLVEWSWSWDSYIKSQPRKIPMFNKKNWQHASMTCRPLLIWDVAMPSMNTRIKFLYILSFAFFSRSCGKHKEEGWGKKGRKERRIRIHNDDWATVREMHWRDGDTNRLSLHWQCCFGLCIYFFPLPANNNLSTKPNQLASLRIDCVLPNNKGTQKKLATDCCCFSLFAHLVALLFLLLLLLLLLLVLLSTVPSRVKTHFSLSVVFSILFGFLVYAEECNHARTHWPMFFLVLPLCILCFVSNTRKLSILHIHTHTSHCLLCTVSHFFLPLFQPACEIPKKGAKRGVRTYPSSHLDFFDATQTNTNKQEQQSKE